MSEKVLYGTKIMKTSEQLVDLLLKTNLEPEEKLELMKALANLAIVINKKEGLDFSTNL